MRESIKMEDYDGFLRFSIPQHKTKNPLLRFIANNISSPVSNFFLTKSLRRYFKYEDEFDKDENFRMPRKDYFFHLIYAKFYNLFRKPYDYWGTLYALDMDAIKKAWEEDPNHQELMKRLKDYNEDGIPYWEE